MIKRDNVILANKAMNELSVIIEKLFNSWLISSNITEDEFLKYRTVKNYEIKMEIESGYCCTRIGYNNVQNGFNQIGESIIFDKTCEDDYMDMCLILICLATKLDNANAVAPVFENRPNYFLSVTQKFIKNNQIMEF